MKWYHVRHDEHITDPCPACDLPHDECEAPKSCNREHVVVMWDHEFWGMVPV